MTLSYATRALTPVDIHQTVIRLAVPHRIGVRVSVSGYVRPDGSVSWQRQYWVLVDRKRGEWEPANGVGGRQGTAKACLRLLRRVIRRRKTSRNARK